MHPLHLRVEIVMCGNDLITERGDTEFVAYAVFDQTNEAHKIYLSAEVAHAYAEGFNAGRNAHLLTP